MVVDILIRVIAVVLGFLGIGYGLKQREEAQRAKREIKAQEERLERTMKEVHDVTEGNKDIVREREEGKTPVAPVPDSVRDRLDRLRK